MWGYCLQVIVRWRRFSESVSRQGAVVDRAVRMHQHRVVGAMQRAVLQVCVCVCVHVRACMCVCGLVGSTQPGESLTENWVEIG
jgi:hypothetical protein